MIIDGRSVARAHNKALKKKVDALDRKPGLAVVLVGKDPASAVYVKRKGVVANRIGFVHLQVDLPEESTTSDVVAAVDTLNADPTIDGILVQLPLPDHIDEKVVTDRVVPSKDVDGLTPSSTGCLSQARPHLIPCTPGGVMVLLQELGTDLSGLDAVVIGRSDIVGRPMAMLLEQANCTVTLCHSRTKNLSDIVGRSDIVVAAVGIPGFVKGAWIKPGAIVFDVGINRLADGRLVGDVEFEAAVGRAAAITPVPGGVGPMTIAMLMANTYRARLARGA